MHITRERAWNVKDESVNACMWRLAYISLSLERVSRSRIWEGLYIERERPHMCIWNVSRINLFKYCIRSVNSYGQKSGKHFCGPRLGPTPDTFSTAYVDQVPSFVPHAHAEIPHMAA